MGEIKDNSLGIKSKDRSYDSLPVLFELFTFLLAFQANLSREAKMNPLVSFSTLNKTLQYYYLIESIVV